MTIQPHRLPRVEDITEIDSSIKIVLLTEENRPAVLELALSMYLGEYCKYCNKQYLSLDDLSNTVFAGYHDGGRLACKECWKDNNS